MLDDTLGGEASTEARLVGAETAGLQDVGFIGALACQRPCQN